MSRWGDSEDTEDVPQFVMPPVGSDPKTEYARGMLLSRIIPPKNEQDLSKTQIELHVYNSEREIIPTQTRFFDKFASQISIHMIRPGHSAYYKFELSITRDEFMKRLAPAEIKSTQPLFHGFFDSVSNIRLSDQEPQIILSIPEGVYDIFQRVIFDLFGNTLKIPNNNYIISSKEEIMVWRDKLYFSSDSKDGMNKYNYAIAKENQINLYLSSPNNKKFSKKHDNTQQGQTHPSQAHSSQAHSSQARNWRDFSRPAWNNQHKPQVQKQEAPIEVHPKVPKRFTEIRKLTPEAIIPNYATPASSGADVNVIRFIEEINGVQFYGCGFSIQPPNNCYYELFARSSLAKKYGLMLANNVGIIDSDYRGELIIQLVPITNNMNARITTFPACIGQLILKSVHQSGFTEVADHSDANTERGTGGFGSTDKKV